MRRMDYTNDAVQHDGDRMPNFWRLRSLQSPARTWARFWGVRAPLRRLKFLLLSVFCLTGMVGCLLDAVVLGSKPFAEVIRLTRPASPWPQGNRDNPPI